jgi:hypothetical protein
MFCASLCAMKVLSVGKSITHALKLFNIFLWSKFWRWKFGDFILLFEECFHFHLLRIYIKR